MTYYSRTDKELEELGIQEGELAIYTGTLNPRKAGTLTPDSYSRNAYVCIWENGQKRELDALFSKDSEGLDVLEVRTGEEEYAFLRDKDSGYIRQVSGPAKPFTLANIGAIPLRADTFLGKFTVHAGTILRLDENAPQREKRKVLLTVGYWDGQPLESARIWDGAAWRPLNIRKEPLAAGEDQRFAVLDGSAIVQYLEVNGKREILMLDSPEPDPDYKMYVATQLGDWVTLRFNRSDYRDGQVVQRSRSIRYGGWGESVIYDLQKLRESLTQNAVRQCTAELPAVPNFLGLTDLTAETRLPDDEIRQSSQKRTHPLISDKLREFLEIEDGSDEQPLASDPASMESREDDRKCSDAVSHLEKLAQIYQGGPKAPTPEPPESFPE